jgi:hypothetical protein
MFSASLVTLAATFILLNQFFTRLIHHHGLTLDYGDFQETVEGAVE